MTDPRLTRRRAVQGVAAAGLGAPVLAACGAEAEPPEAEPSVANSSGAGSEPTPSAEAGAEGDALTTTGDIPVGGGRVFEAEQVVVVQPAAGEFKAYVAVCPHQSCIFTEVADNTIKCGGCHQSEFAASDGTNTVGPNGTDPNLPSLNEVAITVEGDSISLS